MRNLVTKEGQKNKYKILAENAKKEQRLYEINNPRKNSLRGMGLLNYVPVNKGRTKRGSFLGSGSIKDNVGSMRTTKFGSIGPSILRINIDPGDNKSDKNKND